MKVELDLDNEQINFIVGALETAGYGIFEDPSAYDFERDDNEEYNEEEIRAYKEKVCTNVINQLTKQQ